MDVIVAVLVRDTVVVFVFITDRVDVSITDVVVEVDVVVVANVSVVGTFVVKVVATSVKTCPWLGPVVLSKVRQVTRRIEAGVNQSLNLVLMAPHPQETLNSHNSCNISNCALPKLFPSVIIVE